MIKTNLAITPLIIEQFKNYLTIKGFMGDFHHDYPNRLLNATDNSIYELMPQAVIQPKHLDDLKIIINAANNEEFKNLTFTSRGGGTGTNGQSLTSGIVIDLSRFMTRVLEFNPDEKTITVEPGIILSELNQYLKPYGLFFAPMISTENRATIGGMIATDAAGKGSLVYGKTGDHLIGVKLLMHDGTIIDSDPNIINNTIDTKNIYEQIINLINPENIQIEINNRFPSLKRPLSGYNIKQCYQNGQFDLTKIIAGSEGTLGIIAAAKLKLLPIPKHKILVVVHYNTFLDALKDADFLINYKPLAIEAVDEKVQKSATSLPNWPQLAKLLDIHEENYISNFIEFVDDLENNIQEKVLQLKSALDKRKSKYVIITNNEYINQLWSIRSLAVGLAAKMPGNKKPIAFVEDAIVPPENLAKFVEEFQQLLAKKNLDYAMYGHVDVGCIHVRPALNMQVEEDRQKIRPITEEVIKLVTKYKGILWGEHGKGFRGEFVPETFGPILYSILCKIKGIFDPNNRLNPNKIATPYLLNLQLEHIETVPMRGQLDQKINSQLQKTYANAMICNGNGACFNKDSTNVMCPSYKATGDRIHSPKGRATLVKEWLRTQSEKNLAQQKQIAQSTFDAMNGCLGCKGCAGKCPTQVNIPDLRSKFLNTYHELYRKRRFKELLLGHIESILRYIAIMPSLWNFLIRKKIVPTFNLTNLPLFSSSTPLFKELRKRNISFYKDKNQINNFNKNAVVIFVDVFTGFFDNNILFATINILKTFGYSPYIIYPKASGKSLIVGGFINKFQKQAKILKDLLDPLLAANIPIIGLENTITLMFRDEFNNFASPLNGKVFTLAEFFAQAKIDFSKPNKLINKKYLLLSHCTELALIPNEAKLWQDIFLNLKIPLEIKNTGCCGMAGSYGYQKEHQENSKKLFIMHWQPYLENNEVIASGFSCRSQVNKLAKKTILHPIEIIWNHLK